MDKEIKAAVMAFTGIALGLLWAIAVFRFIVLLPRVNPGAGHR